MIYYDIHTHLKALASPEEQVSIVNTAIGMEEDEWDAYPARWRSVGIHPWYIIEDGKSQLSSLRTLAARPDVVAIGEAGLDKTVETPLDKQLDIFTEQAYLAEERGKPLIIHCVKAWPDLIACQKRIRPQVPWIIHGFRGNGILAAQLLRFGFYLSFGARFQPEAVQAAWPGHLFTETDESSIPIHSIYKSIADALGITLAELSTQIARNISIFPLNDETYRTV